MLLDDYRALTGILECFNVFSGRIEGILQSLYLRLLSRCNIASFEHVAPALLTELQRFLGAEPIQQLIQSVMRTVEQLDGVDMENLGRIFFDFPSLQSFLPVAESIRK